MTYEFLMIYKKLMRKNHIHFCLILKTVTTIKLVIIKHSKYPILHSLTKHLRYISLTYKNKLKFRKAVMIDSHDILYRVNKNVDVYFSFNL